MILKLQNSKLFSDMSISDIQKCLSCSQGKIRSFEKDEFIFYQQDKPRELFLLIEGTVAVGNDSDDGKRNIVATFDKAGELFGEVFVFLDKQEFEHYAKAVTNVKVLSMPKDFFFYTCEKKCSYHSKLIANMLSILANKAYYLNKKVQILSSVNLRQKIAKVLLQNSTPDGSVMLYMNREELADYLNTARPSLSRELMNMQKDGLIKIDKKNIYIVDFEKIKNI